MLKMALIIGILAVVLVGAGIVFSFHPRSGFAHGSGRFMDCMVDKFADTLELESDQRTQLMQMAEVVKSKRQEIHSLHQGTRQEVISEIRKVSIDKQKIDALFNDAKERFDEMYNLFSTEFIAFHQTLTSEQKEKLVAQMEKHHQRRRCFRDQW